MNFVKKFLGILFLLFLFNINTFIYSKDLEMDGVSFEDDFDALLNDDNPIVGQYLDDHHFSLSKKEKPTPEEVINILVNIVGIDQLLQEDIFLATYPLVKRSLLDNSLLNYVMDKRFQSGKYVFSTEIFYEQTSRMYFSAPCQVDKSCSVDPATCIRSYLGLCSPTLMCKLRDLEQRIKEIFPDFSINCEKGITLIKNATAQDRNFGCFFTFEAMLNKINVRFKVPFYYKERNLYLTSAERTAIAKEFGEYDMKEGLTFARQHLISDQLGFGDSRIEFECPVATGPRDLEIRLGAYATIPTGFALVKGLLGQVYKPVTCRPTINFIELFDQAQSDATRPEAMETGSNLSLCALDNISALLLDTSLGNNGHFGLGGRFHNNLPMRSFLDKKWLDNIFLRGNISVEYLLPKHEARYFVNKDNPALFSDRDFNDESKAAENLAFLEQMTINRLFPFVYDAKICPGFIFILEEKFTYEKKKWGIHLGSDLWVQTREKICDICAPKDKLSDLDVQKATKPWAYQCSVFGSLFFKPKKKKGGDLYVGLNFEKVVASRAIGKPFKIILSLDRNF